jgi:putative ABC transport system substrate-binding protein
MRLVCALVLLLAVAAGPALAQAPDVARVGLLAGGTREIEADRVDVLKDSLAQLGWRQGTTLALDERYAGGDSSRIATLAGELVATRPHVLVSIGTTETRALAAATGSIPILFMQVPDPVGSGLVRSIARPDANVTGISGGPQLLNGKRLELMTELLGRPRRVAWLGNPANAGAERAWANATEGAPALGIALMRVDVAAPTGIEPAFRRLADFDGVLVQWDFLFLTERAAIAEAAARQRLPAIYENRAHVLAGGLMSYGPDLRDNYRRGAAYIDRVLKGAKPADLPVDEASRFELAINLRTARALDLAVPPSLLARADEVIE